MPCEVIRLSVGELVGMLRTIFIVGFAGPVFFDRLLVRSDMANDGAVVPINALRGHPAAIGERLHAFHDEYAVLEVEQFERSSRGILVVMGRLGAPLDLFAVEFERVGPLFADAPLDLLVKHRNQGIEHQIQKNTAFSTWQEHHIVNRSSSEPPSSVSFAVRIMETKIVVEPNSGLRRFEKSGQIGLGRPIVQYLLDFR